MSPGPFTGMAAGRAVGGIPVDKGCASIDFWTPEKVLGPVRAYFADLGYPHGIELDPANDATNPTQAREFFTKDDDGLACPWGKTLFPRHIFVNPPYGTAIWAWVGKIHEEAGRGHRIVTLLPGQRFEQRRWQQALFTPRLTAFVAITSRLNFRRPGGDRIASGGNPYGSFLCCYNGLWESAVERFAPIGMVIQPGRIEQQRIPRVAGVPLGEDGSGP